MKLFNRKINKMKSKEKKERIIQSLLFYASENSIGTEDIKDGTMESTDTIAST